MLQGPRWKRLDLQSLRLSWKLGNYLAKTRVLIPGFVSARYELMDWCNLEPRLFANHDHGCPWKSPCCFQMIFVHATIQPATDHTSEVDYTLVSSTASSEVLDFSTLFSSLQSRNCMVAVTTTEQESVQMLYAIHDKFSWILTQKTL
jgi:hypothetical protein